MARIKYTALVESIRGSIQGTTFQRNAYGYTVKGKPNMVNPNTSTQSRSKKNMTGIAQAWSSLSSTNRAAWNTWAETNPVPSRLNPDAMLTGFAQFTRWHNIRWLYQYGSVLANPSGAVGTIESLQFNVVRNPMAQIAVVLIEDVIYTEGPWVALAFLSRPLKQTQQFVKSWTRFIGADGVAEIDPGVGQAEIDLPPVYSNIFGALPLVGDRVALRMAFQNTTNGQLITQSAEVVTVI